MKYIFFFFLTFLTFSCDSPNVDTNADSIATEIRVIERDHFKNGDREIDSLKELSIKEGLQGNFQRFKYLCELVTSKDSTDADNLSRLATIYLINKEFETGLFCINRSIKLDTGHFLNYNYTLKAALFRELHQDDSANIYFDKMLTEGKEHGLDLNSLVDALISFKMYDRAQEYNELVLKYYPFDAEANIKKAMELYLRKPDEAILLLTQIEPHSKNAKLYATRSLFYHNLKQYDLALRDADKAVEMSHGEPWIITGRGRTRHSLKDFKGAESDYKYSIERGDTTAIRFYRLLLADKNKM